MKFLIVSLLLISVSSRADIRVITGHGRIVDSSQDMIIDLSSANNGEIDTIAFDIDLVGNTRVNSMSRGVLMNLPSNTEGKIKILLDLETIKSIEFKENVEDLGDSGF